MISRRQALQVLGWGLLVGAVAIMVGGLIYDGSRSGEEPNLSGLYAVAVVMALAAMALNYQVRRRSGTGPR